MARNRGIVSVKERFPSFYSFGPRPRFLTHAEAIAASPEERIASVWPHAVSRVIEYARRLRPREMANFDQEDAIQEIWLVLREKDAGWVPERGVYITFAGKLIDRALLTIRERSHTVESPRNTGTRIRQFEGEVAAGPITEKKTKTFGDIRRSIGEFDPIEECVGGPDPADGVEAAEDADVVRDAVSEAVRCLTPNEARVIGRTYGLWGQPIWTSLDVAEDTGRCPDAIKKLKASATAKIRERLLAMGHPAVASDN